MAKKERILVINPGSTSTKLAVFDDDERAIPWPHDCVRDARTYILSNLSLLHSVGFFRNFDPAYNPERPYDIIPKRPGWVKHQADSDVLQMIWNLNQVTSLLLEAMHPA